MFLRTEGDFIRTVNAARDLTNLIMQYLAIWKKYANGRGGVTIPSEDFCIIFTKMNKPGYVGCKLVYTATTYSEEPVYYDTDSDYFSETGFGSGNLSHTVTHTHYSPAEKSIYIPFRALMMPPEKMTKEVIAFVEQDKARIAEEERLARIAKLQEELAALQSGS